MTDRGRRKAVLGPLPGGDNLERGIAGCALGGLRGRKPSLASWRTLIVACPSRARLMSAGGGVEEGVELRGKLLGGVLGHVMPTVDGTPA